MRSIPRFGSVNHQKLPWTSSFAAVHHPGFRVSEQHEHVGPQNVPAEIGISNLVGSNC